MSIRSSYVTPLVAAGRVLVRRDIYDILSDNKESTDNKSLVFLEKATAKIKRREKKKRSNISINNYRPTYLKENKVKTENKDKESVALIIIKKRKKVKVAP